jgi:hypothetical protein
LDCSENELFCAQLKAFLSCIAGLRKENLPAGRQERQGVGAKKQFYSQLKKFK